MAKVFDPVCVHEAGHFYVAFLHRPELAISISISRQVNTDPLTSQSYVSPGRTVTHDRECPLRVQVSIRAGGLAAEGLVFGRSFSELMETLKFEAKTDIDNARNDVKRARQYRSEDEFISFYWRTGFDDATAMMRGCVGNVRSIAWYCQANLVFCPISN